MIKKAKKLAAVFIVLALLVQTSFVCLASDESNIVVAYDAVNKSITIGGNADVPSASPVTVNVISYEKGAPSATNLPVVSGMFFAGADGKLNYEIPLADDFSAGKYSVYLGMVGLDEAFKASIMVFDKNSQETADVLEIVNAAKSSSEMTVAVTNGAGALGIDKDTVDDMNAVCKVVYGIFKAEGEFDYEGFNRAFRAGLASGCLADGESVDSVMNQYANVFETDYDTYAALDSDVKKAFGTVIENTDMSKGYVSFDDVVILATLISADNNEEFKACILDNADFFGIDTDGDYDDLSVNNKAKVFKTIFADRAEFYSCEDVEKAFDKAVEKLLKEAEDKKQSSSSGSSGSGGGNSFSVSVPQTNTPVVTPDVNVPDAETPEIQTPVNKYSDISGHFAESSIMTLSDMEIINGFEDSTFRPNDYVTRAQLAKMTVAALEIAKGSDVRDFADVTSADWFCDAVSILSSNNIVSGDGTNFYPQAFVTRQDAAVILYRALESKDKKLSGKSEFADQASISDYAIEAVGAMAANGIILGDASGFRPLSQLTRGEVAVLICRIINAN